MERSESFTTIVKAMVKVQGELKAVKKDRDNEFNHSKYATLDAILAELLPKLSENEIAMTQSPVFEEAGSGAMRIGVETHLIHSSGEWFLYPPFFMELEKGAKMNMAQSAGSIITYAKRYAISAIFGISTDEDKDGVQPKPMEDNRRQNNHSAPAQEQRGEQVANTDKMIGKYIRLLKQAECDTDQICAEIAKDAGVSDIRQMDRIRALGELKTRYVAIENEAAKRQKQNVQQEAQANVQQESLLEGRTTQPVNWGKL